MTNSNIQEQLIMERIYDDTIVGLGTVGATKYRVKERITDIVLAYIVLEKMEENIYFPRLMRIDDSIRVLKLWESRRGIIK